MISVEVDFEAFNKNFKNSGSQFDQISKTRVTLKIKKNICIHFRKFTFSLENNEERQRGISLLDRPDYSKMPIELYRQWCFPILI